MVDFQSAQHSIHVDPELVDYLTRDSTLGPWHQFPEYWLGDIVEDGEISYDEGCRAAYGAYQTLKTIEALPGFKQAQNNDLNKFVNKLRELETHLVTIVDEQKQIIRVHGVDIHIEGDPNIEEMIAIGEGIRRHEPWLVKEIFTDRPGRKKTRIYFGEKEHWAKQIGSPPGFKPEEMENNGLFASRGEFSIIFLSSPWWDFLNNTVLDPVKHLTWNPIRPLVDLADHEFGHAILHAIANSINRASSKESHQSNNDTGNRDQHTWAFQQKACLPQLDQAYEKELIEVFLPDKLDVFLAGENLVPLIMKIRENEAQNSGLIVSSSDWDIASRIKNRHLRVYSFVDGDEFVTDGYQLFRHPEKQDAFSVHVPVMAAFFTFLENASPDSFDDPRICERISKVLDQAKKKDSK